MAREDKLTLIMQELVRRSNEESRRLRSLEQRVFALETRLQSMETTDSLRIKKASDKITEFEVATKMQNEILMKLKNNLEKLTKQTEKYARKSEVKEIEKMFDLLSPASQQFVTKKDLEDFRRRIKA